MSDTADSTPQGNDQEQDPQAQGSDSTQPQGSSTDQGEQTSQDTGKVYTEADLKKVRDEAAGRRTELRQTEQERDQLKATLDQLRKALDPDSKDEDDPKKVAEKATAERDATNQELRALRIERAADKAARKHGADPDALTDSKAFEKAAEGLDPEADDFASKLDELVKTTVENNPKLKAGQAPSRSGSEFTGGSGNKSTFSRSQIAGMSQKEYADNEEAILKAMSEGRITRD